MWHEQYQPVQCSDVVWSLPKVKELQNLIRNFSARNTPHAALLLYGPTGAAKSSSLLPIVRAVEPNAISATFSTGQVDADRGVDATANGLLRFLSTSSSSNALDRGDEERRANEAAAPSLSSSSNPQGVDDVLWIRIVKLIFLHPEGLFHPREQALSQILVQHLNHMAEKNRQAGLHLRPQTNVLGENLATGQERETTVSINGRSLTVFVFTAHDTHSDKVLLRSTFPVSFLQHPLLVTFHCTAPTNRALLQRLQTIMMREVGDGAATSNVPAGGGGPRGGKGRTASKRQREDTAAARRGVVPLPNGATAARPLYRRALSEAELSNVLARSKGDIRQALLQCQWETLDPNCAAARVAAPSLLASAGDAASRSLSSHESGVIKVDGDHSGQVQRDVEVVDVDGDELINIDDDEEEDEAERAFQRTMFGGARSIGATSQPPRKMRRAEHSPLPLSPQQPSSQSSSLSQKAKRTVLDLLDDDSTSNNPAAAVITAVTAPNSSSSLSSTGTPTPATAPPAAGRDDYVDVSHATARLLTQKYSLPQVLESLFDVPAWKLASYFCHNLYDYFGPEQILSYAECLSAASHLERYIQQGSGADGDTDKKPLSDYTVGAEQDLNIAGSEKVVDGSGSLPQLGMHLLHRSYLVMQKAVRVPQGFRPQYPPPYRKSCFPRWVDQANKKRQSRLAERRNRHATGYGYGGDDDDEEEDDEAPVLIEVPTVAGGEQRPSVVVGVHQSDVRFAEAVDRAKARWEVSGGSTSSVTALLGGGGRENVPPVALSSSSLDLMEWYDVYREILMPPSHRVAPLTAVALEYLPLAAKILFPTTTRCPTDAPQRGPLSVPAVQAIPPTATTVTKTMFRLGPVPPPPAPPLSTSSEGIPPHSAPPPMAAPPPPPPPPAARKKTLFSFDMHKGGFTEIAPTPSSQQAAAPDVTTASSSLVARTTTPCAAEPSVVSTTEAALLWSFARQTPTFAGTRSRGSARDEEDGYRMARMDGAVKERFRILSESELQQQQQKGSRHGGEDDDEIEEV